MAVPRTIEIRVSRKLTHNYNSTEYGACVTLDLSESESKATGKVPELIQQWTEELRESIRQEFTRGNGRNTLPQAVTDPPTARIGTNGHAH